MSRMGDLAATDIYNAFDVPGEQSTNVGWANRMGEILTARPPDNPAVAYKTPYFDITEGDIGRATEAAMGVSGGGLSTKFRAYRAHNPGESQSGHAYYALDENTAKAYLDPAGVVREHNIELNNPLVLNTPEKVQSAWDTSGALKVPGDFYPHQQSALNDWARKQGYDGLVVPHSAFEGEAGYKIAGGTFGEPQIVKFQPPGIRAYHSSPHDFDKFDLSKIGTGEGAQVYGHGLYFAENPAVSGRGGQYWQQFNEPHRFGNIENAAATRLWQHDFDRAAALAKLEGDIDHVKTRISKAGSGANLEGMQTALRDWQAQRDLLASGQPVGPRTYEVNINADPAHMLDWDKAFRSQTPDVGKVLTSISQNFRFGGERPIGLFANEALKTKRVSEALREAGIPGIKYLDQGSRAVATPETIATLRASIAKKEAAHQADPWLIDTKANSWGERNLSALNEERRRLEQYLNPSSNYVIFDPNIIDIMKKYAVPGAIGTGTMGALAAQDRYQQ